MDSCLFCKIISGEIPSERVYEDADTFAFLDINPINPGHTLVIPKQHYVSIYDIPEEVWCAVSTTVKNLSPVIKLAMGAEGINIEMNNDSAAGQVVFHTHVHIVPRHEKDGFKHWPGTPYRNNEIAEVAHKIKSTISNKKTSR